MMKTLGPYQLGWNDTEDHGVITGDSLSLAKTVPAWSVDIIFTDPVYSRPQDYTWLAYTARRVLKPGGVMVTWLATDRLVECKPLQLAHKSVQLAFSLEGE